MKRQAFNIIVIAFVMATILAMIATGEARADTAFTYQGRLTQAGDPYSGSANMVFTLYDAAVGGSVVGGPLPMNGINVSAGLFTVQLDFGAEGFEDSPRWLGVTVNSVALSPRQPITGAPYAIQTRGLYVDDDLRVGFGTTEPIFKVHVAGPTGVRADATGIVGVWGTTSNGFMQSTGVLGQATALGGLTYGVRGESASTAGRGVFGKATAESGETYGGRFESASTTGRGVFGHATADSGNTYGVYGRTDSSVGGGGKGVFGEATSTIGFTTYGVYGKSSSFTGRGVQGVSHATAGLNYGVYGQSFSTGGIGVYGATFASTGNTFGGQFEVNSSAGTGVFGRATASTGQTYGGYFTTSSTSGVGLYAHAEAGSGATYGIHCHNDSPNGWSGYFTGARTYFETAVGIGIKNSGSPGFQLHLSANSAAKPTSNTWTISSDARLKKNINTIEHALDDLLALRGVTYQWIDPASQGGMDGTYTGFIAQEVEQVFPEWITEDASTGGAGGYKHLTVIGFEGLVVEALRELRDEKDAEIALLRRANENLNARLDALTQLVERLATTQKETLK